jgi:hypothetical protein
MMAVDSSLAARIDRVEARLVHAVASAVAANDATARTQVIAIGDGIATFARSGSPVSKVIGVGFDGPLDAAVLATIETAWREREEPVRVELASLASTDAALQLSERGYHLLGFEHVLVRSLATLPPRAQHVDVTHGRDDAAWMRILVDGFAAGDGTGATVDDYARDAIEQVMRDMSWAPGFSRYVASLDGTPVGAATMRIDDGIALMGGAATLPTSRRRGVQGALLAARLADARDAGCELAIVTTAPGSQSQANVMRSGFALAYARAILVR